MNQIPILHIKYERKYLGTWPNGKLKVSSETWG